MTVRPKLQALEMFHSRTMDSLFTYPQPCTLGTLAAYIDEQLQAEQAAGAR